MLLSAYEPWGNMALYKWLYYYLLLLYMSPRKQLAYITTIKNCSAFRNRIQYAALTFLLKDKLTGCPWEKVLSHTLQTPEGSLKDSGSTYVKEALFTKSNHKDTNESVYLLCPIFCRLAPSLVRYLIRAYSIARKWSERPFRSLCSLGLSLHFRSSPPTWTARIR